MWALSQKILISCPEYWRRRRKIECRSYFCPPISPVSCCIFAILIHGCNWREDCSFLQLQDATSTCSCIIWFQSAISAHFAEDPDLRWSSATPKWTWNRRHRQLGRLGDQVVDAWCHGMTMNDISILLGLPAWDFFWDNSAFVPQDLRAWQTHEWSTQFLAVSLSVQFQVTF